VLLVWDENAWEDYLWWQAQDRRVLKRINLLLTDFKGGSTFLGRDHHPHCFTIWLAGAGIRGGLQFGATDELGYTITENPMSIHELQATMLHLLGLDPYNFRFPYLGLQQRLIGVEGDAKIRKELLA